MAYSVMLKPEVLASINEFLQKHAVILTNVDSDILQPLRGRIKEGNTLAQDAEALIIEGMLIRGFQKRVGQKKLDLLSSQIDRKDDMKIPDAMVQPVLLAEALAALQKGQKRKHKSGADGADDTAVED